jgi:hypothetical protein
MNSAKESFTIEKAREVLTYENASRKLRAVAAASRQSRLGTKLKILVTAYQVIIKPTIQSP